MGESGSGHAVPMQIKGSTDAATTAPSPLELVLVGTGGCTTVDVVLILRRGRHDIRGCAVELDAERAENEPRVFTKIHYHFIVTGRGLKREAVQRAIDLSAEKYCSATVMLSKTAKITHDFEIREVD
jgi:putative redox protein